MEQRVKLQFKKVGAKDVYWRIWKVCLFNLFWDRPVVSSNAFHYSRRDDLGDELLYCERALRFI